MRSNSATYGIEAVISVNERLVARVTSGPGGRTIVATLSGVAPRLAPRPTTELGYQAKQELVRNTNPVLTDP